MTVQSPALKLPVLKLAVPKPTARRLSALLAVTIALLATALSLKPAEADVPSALVDSAWLKSQLATSGLVVVDIRSPIGKSSADAYKAGHIPGSTHSAYPGAWRTEKDGVVGVLPDIAALEDHIGSLGITNESTVVIVPTGAGATEFGAAARIHWTLRYLGHDDVAILDGGWKAWSADPANPVTSEPTQVSGARFTASPRPELLVTTADVQQRLNSGAVLIDARPRKQFVGNAKHPKATRLGRLPGSVNVQNFSFYEDDNERLKTKTALASTFYDQVKGHLAPQATIAGATAQSSRKSDDPEIISYCNTGHWAATNWFVMSEVLGLKNVRLYDHSMVGWTQNAALPVETGE